MRRSHREVSGAEQDAHFPPTLRPEVLCADGAAMMADTVLTAAVRCPEPAGELELLHLILARPLSPTPGRVRLRARLRARRQAQRERTPGPGAPAAGEGARGRTGQCPEGRGAACGGTSPRRGIWGQGEGV